MSAKCKQALPTGRVHTHTHGSSRICLTGIHLPGNTYTLVQTSLLFNKDGFFFLRSVLVQSFIKIDLFMQVLGWCSKWLASLKA